MEAIPPKKTRLAALKTVSPATWLGALATLAFLVLCQFDNTVIRWWLMLPLAIAGGALLLWRRRRALGSEARACTLLLGLLLALVVLRDIGLSRKLAELYDKMNQYKTQVNELSGALDRFFNGGR